MSFADGFYSYAVELNLAEREIYTSFRIKTPKHPLESLERLHARVLAFAHAYRDGQIFTPGLFSPEDPAFYCADSTGALNLWADIGVPEPRKLRRALRGGSGCEYRIYFTQNEEADRFCHLMRGSKENWVEPVQFYLLPQNLVALMVENSRSSSNLTLTISDETAYFSFNNQEAESQFLRIDIWERYQKTIQNADSPPLE